MVPLQWSRWIALDADLLTYQEHVVTDPGFYRVRAVGNDWLVYIGQTGRSLRQRTRAELAKHVMRPRESPPWNDPHTAAPLLWAYRYEDGMEFELSVAPAHLDVQMRQCYEDVLLYLHRLEFGHSTLCNHGRRHPGGLEPPIARMLDRHIGFLRHWSIRHCQSRTAISIPVERLARTKLDLF